MALQLLDKDQQPMVGHALRIEDAVEVIAFVLDDAGVEALRPRARWSRRRGRWRGSGSAGGAGRRRADPGPTGSLPSRRPARRPNSSTTGLISTVRSWATSPGIPVRRSPETKNTTIRQGWWTCGAARPVPPASSIVSIMSSTSRRTQGAGGSSTAAARRRSTGLPMRAIFSKAMPALCGRRRSR